MASTPPPPTEKGLATPLDTTPPPPLEQIQTIPFEVVPPKLTAREIGPVLPLENNSRYTHQSFSFLLSFYQFYGWLFCLYNPNSKTVLSLKYLVKGRVFWQMLVNASTSSIEWTGRSAFAKKTEFRVCCTHVIVAVASSVVVPSWPRVRPRERHVVYIPFKRI